MKPGFIGLALFVLGGLGLITLSPLFSPDLALVPPGPINLPRFTLLYYLPRVMLSAVLTAAAVVVIFTDKFSNYDRYWAYGTIATILISWGFWLRD